MKQAFRLLVLSAVVIFMLSLLTFRSSHAVDYYWIGGSGSWNDPANWNPSGPPGGYPDNAFLTQSDSTNRTVDLSTGASINRLSIDATGTGTMTLDISGPGGLGLASGARIGINGVGIINQSGGGVGYIYAIVLGVNPGSSGIYNLSGGSIGSRSDPLVVGVNGTGIFNQTGGYATPDSFSVNEKATYNLSGGVSSQTTGSADIAGTVNQTGGSFRAPWGLYVDINGKYNWSGGELYVSPGKMGFRNDGTVNLSGVGTRTVNGIYGFGTGSIENNGTWNVKNTTAVYTGTATFTNNGAYISHLASQHFNDLVIGQNGYLVGGYGDKWFINGDFKNYSMRASDWDTSKSYLEFLTGVDLQHDFYITGVDYGATFSGYYNNFSWGALDVTGNALNLFDGNTVPGGALYLEGISGLAVSGDQIFNIFGQDGLNIYYLAYLPQNSYLGGLTYDLQGGGHLIPSVPEPSVILLVGCSLVGLIGLRKLRK